MTNKSAVKLFGILLAVFCVFLSIVNAAPGDLDTTFAGTGFVREASGVGSYDIIFASAIQPDGKIVSVGWVAYGGDSLNCGITRHNSDGSLDTSFDGDGKVIPQIGLTFGCQDVAVQADGKIVVVGYVQNGSIYNMAVFRYNSDGTPDTSFDGDGRKVSAFINADFAYAVAIQADGKILVCGNVGDEFALVRYNGDGSLDTSFDGDGWLYTDFFGGTDHSRAIAIQTDGKIVIAGNGRASGSFLNDFAVARYNSDGSLDTSFSGDGKVLTDIQGNHDNAEDIAIQADGKIVVGGMSWGSNADFGIVRYNADGSLDTSFDGDGKFFSDVSGPHHSLNGLAIQADGKIVAVGGNGDIQLIRLNSNGSFDNSFDADGKITLTISQGIDNGNAVVLQPDGKILVAGNNSTGFTQSSVDFALVRLNPNAAFDTSFDGDGIVATNIRSWKINAQAVAIQPDGKIVAVGRGHLDNEGSKFSVYRYNPNGTPDTSFDGDGKVVTNFSGSDSIAIAVAFQPDGKIILAGYAYQDAAIIRLNSNGSPDTSFGFNGARFESSGSGGAPGSCTISTVAVQTDGKILAGGWCYNNFNVGIDFTIYRYNPDGSRDNSFDGDGKVQTDFSTSYQLRDQINAMAIQPDGKIVAAGVADFFQNKDFAIARYNTDGSLDTSFDTDGKATTNFTDGNDYANAAAIQADGKIVAAGYSSDDSALVRYNTNGSLDTSFDGDGKVRVSLSNIFDTATGVVIQTDGKIVTSGYAAKNLGNDTATLNNDFALVRYNPNGSLDVSYGTGGKSIIDLSINDLAYGIVLDSSGRAVVAGETGGLFTVARFLGGAAPSNVLSPFDFDGDGKSDISIFRPSNGEWWYLRSSDGGNYAAQFGNSQDKLTPADFTGDGKADVALWRPSTGEWFVLRSENQSYYSFQFGTTGDIPSVGDFDLDGKADATVFRPSTGTWYVNMSTGGTIINHFGQSGDVPVIADYDDDGKADMAIYRVAQGQWWIQRSTAGLIAFQFGNSSDKPVQGDYTGDGKADVALFRPVTGEWFVLRSENQSYYSFSFGTNGDLSAPGDYDGDGKFDATVFRPSNNTWYSQRTTAGTLIQTFGQSGDLPVPNAFFP